MTILLLRPPLHGADHQDRILPPVGLLTLAGALRRAGRNVALVDGAIDEAGWRGAVRALSPSAVILWAADRPRAHQAALRAAGGLDGLPLAYAGPAATRFWRESLLLQPAIRWIIRGEPEDTARRLVQCLDAGRPATGLTGTAWREGGDIRIAPPALAIRDLDDCPHAFDLADPADYPDAAGRPTILAEFGRGRPDFAHGPTPAWRRFRHRAPDALAAALIRLARLRPNARVLVSPPDPTPSGEAWRSFRLALADGGIAAQPLPGSGGVEDCQPRAPMLSRRAGSDGGPASTSAGSDRSVSARPHPFPPYSRDHDPTAGCWP